MAACAEGYVVYAPTGECTQTPEFRLQKVLGDYLTAAQLGQYGDPPPSVEAMGSMLAAEAQQICSMSFIPCGGDPTSLIQSALAEYASWLQNVVPNATPTTPDPVVSVISAPDVKFNPTFYNPVYDQQGPFYNPSAGFVAQPGSMPVEKSPTIPAYTSPANILATAVGSRTAAAGGTDIAGTAAGAGTSQGGSGEQQNSLQPTGPAAVVADSLGGKSNTKLLVILLVLAVAVILFGRN
jgi:hypothetical protein